jgi:hypothetical protein
MLRGMILAVGITFATTLAGTTAQAAATYGHVWDVHYHSSTVADQPLYNAEAIQRVEGFGLNVALYDYCQYAPSNDPYCQPSSSSPHPAWVLFQFEVGGPWSDWYYKADATRSDSPFWHNGDPNDPFYYTRTSASFGCYRISSGNYNNNWYCQAGGGNGSFWSYIEAKYGEGSS